MACEEYKEASDRARENLERAALAREQARYNLEAAWMEWATAVAAQVACLFLAETVIGFAACELAATIAAEKAATAIRSAEIALELAERAESEAAQAWHEAHDTYCDCLRLEGAGDFPTPGEIWQSIEEAEATIEEAEEAVAEADADLDEAESLVADAADALAEAEDDAVLIG